MTSISYGPVGTFGSGGAAATSGTSSATTKSSTSKDDPNAVDKDMFLKLLVAQLKYQDPNNATDPSEFLSQTAQFTTVEKLNALESLSQQVYDASRQQTATALIGTTVTYTDVAGKAQTGLVTGVSIGASTPNLTINGVPISLDKITAADAPRSATR